MTILMRLLVLLLSMKLSSHCFWVVSLSTMTLVLYSSVSFIWLLCIWYLWRTIFIGGLWGIGLTAVVSSCCDVENFVHLYSIYIHIYTIVYINRFLWNWTLLKMPSVKLFHNNCNSSQSILAIIVLLGQMYFD